MKKEAKYLIIVLIGIVLYFVEKYVNEFFSFIQTDLLNGIAYGLVLISSEILIIIFISLIFVLKKQKRTWLFPLWFTMGVSTAAGLLLKLIIQRARPFQQGIASILPFITQNTYTTWNTSFPSFHALLMFSVIPLISKEFPKLKYPWIIFTVLALMSRMYFGLHFITDIFFGGLIGYLLGTIILNIEKKDYFWRNLYQKLSSKKK